MKIKILVSLKEFEKEGGRTLLISMAWKRMAQGPKK